MSAQSPALTHSWRVGNYTATMTLQKPRRGRMAACAIEWAPHPPSGLTSDEMVEYRRGRDTAIQALGLNTLPIKT